jgi:hypothetical protein
MSGGIYQVKLIRLAVCGSIGDSDRLAFYGDSPFPLNVHVVEDLVLKVAVLHQMAFLDKPIGQGGLTMINVGDDAKVPDQGDICHLQGVRRVQ